MGSERFEYDAVVAGYIGVDLAPRFPAAGAAIPIGRLLRPGKLVQVEGLTISLGGAVANTGIALKMFGRRTALRGIVGNDVLGDIVQDLLARHGFTNAVARKEGVSTAFGIVIAPPGTDRVFLECPGANDTFCAADVDYETTARSRLFHFGYPTLMQRLFEHDGAELERMLRRVKGLGVVTCLDTTLPDPDSPAGAADWPGILRRALPYVDIFLPSIEELLFMLDRSRYEQIAKAAGENDIIDCIPDEVYRDLGDQVLAMGPEVLLIKAGHRGGYLRTGNVEALVAGGRVNVPVGNWSDRELHLPAFRPQPDRVQNASGAGDAAVAGFLAAVLAGTTIEDAGAYAMLAGRNNLYGVDAVSGLTDWESMTAELRGMPFETGRPHRS